MNNATFKGWNIALWIAQALLAAMFFLAGMMKTFSPLSELVARGMDYGTVITRFIGMSELLGGVCLILPSILRVKPMLTIWTAIGITVIMVIAVGYHFLQSDLAGSMTPALLGLMALIIAWGRSEKIPYSEK